MSRNRYGFAIMCLSMVVGLLSPVAFAQDERTPAQLWDDFNHYVRIARPELAHAHGAALLGQVSDSQLLDIAEAGNYPDWLENTIAPARGMESVRATAEEIAKRIQDARIARAREVERIKEDIERLGRGLQARQNAVERLRAAGQYAAPHLLEALLDHRRTNLHPHVLTAMVAIGRPLVYPLAEALPHLEPVPQGQIAQVLAELGYPMALPYLKVVLENSSADPTARAAVEAAYNLISRQSGAGQFESAADLFFVLALNQFNAGSRGEQIVGYDPAEDKGIVWDYSPRAGLVPIPVPGPVFADALSMRSAAHALRLTPNMDQALSLWVMANLRRENRMPEGAQDPSYNKPQPPSYYAMLAGPMRLHEVLSRALEDRDADLALDAIEALDKTAGTEALLNLRGPIQPLLESLSYPDRRVRYAAAFALTNARPTEAFPGSYQVVPVLADAVRQTDQLYALVIADEQSARNELQAVVRGFGYEVITGPTLESVSDQLRTVPGVDLIVVQSTVNNVIGMFNRGAIDYKLASVPVLAIATQADQLTIESRMPNERRLFMTTLGADSTTLGAAVENARSSATGVTLTSAQATAYAVRALQLLRDVALTSGNVYVVTDAQSALTLALNDTRDEVVTGAAAVLALIDNVEAQTALAELALDNTRTVNIRGAAMNSLADSATAYGNLLDDRVVDRLLEAVKTSTGPLAVDAAKAFGALSPASRNPVELIVQ